MRRSTLLPLFAGLLLLASAAPARDLLKDYEPVEPALALESPEVVSESFPQQSVDRGRYLVELLGCGSCHTDGALNGWPDKDRILAGSGVGIATSNPLQVELPGVVYPANLTPDMETGLGQWNVEQIVLLLKSGIDNHGEQTLPVMPWRNYANLTQEDATAIAMYLKSLPAVQHAVPENVRRGQPAPAPYVHFGVYRSIP